MFHRAEFQQVLLRRLPKRCQTHCSKRLRSYSQRRSGPIDLLFEDGSTTTCDVLIGADGLKSAVRKSFMGEKTQRGQSDGTEIVDINASTDAVWSGTIAYRALIPAERLKARAPNHRVFSQATQVCWPLPWTMATDLWHRFISIWAKMAQVITSYVIQAVNLITVYNSVPHRSREYYQLCGLYYTTWPREYEFRWPLDVYHGEVWILQYIFKLGAWGPRPYKGGLYIISYRLSFF